MSSYSARDTTAYTATAISTTTIATIDMASNITRHRSDTELASRRTAAPRGLRNLAVGAPSELVDRHQGGVSRST